MNPISWFEIPTENLERAYKFYSKLFPHLQLKKVGEKGSEMYVFDNNMHAYGATGALVCHELFAPSREGTCVYFGCEDVQQQLYLLIAMEAEILMEKTKMQ